MEKNKWYKLKTDFSNGEFYFLFENLEDDCRIYHYNFLIKNHNGVFSYICNNYIGKRRHLIYKKDKISEIDVSFVIKYLPNDHPDKISYLRQQKIKKLLCN